MAHGRASSTLAFGTIYKKSPESQINAIQGFFSLSVLDALNFQEGFDVILRPCLGEYSSG